MGCQDILYTATNTERGGKKEEYYVIPSLTLLSKEGKSSETYYKGKYFQ